MANVELWTDGSSRGVVGDGGWACVLRFEKDGEMMERELSGYCADTTNQRMEMIAVLMGLRALKFRCHVTVYTDSAYVMNAFVERWIVKWRKNGWIAGRGSKKKPVDNRDIWEALDAEVAKHHVIWTKVKGHHTAALFPINDRMDELAREARDAGMDRHVEIELPEVENLALAM